MKAVLSLFLLLAPSMLFCQMNAKTASKIKNSKLYIGLTEIDETDTNLKKSIYDYWHFNANYDFENLSRKSKDISTLRLMVSNIGATYVIRLGNGSRIQDIGFNKYSELSYYDFVEAVKRAQFIMKEIIEAGSWAKVFKSTKKKYGKELKDKTLLVDRRLLKEKLSEEKFKAIYPYAYKFVDKEEVRKAVLENDESKVYFSIVEEKVGVYVQYICNAGTGKIYTHKHSVFQPNEARANKLFDRYVGEGDLKDLSRRIQ